MPECAAHVWQWFGELSSQRHTGPEAISWAELKAWAELTGSQPTPEEIRMLMAIDCAYIVAVRKLQKAAMEKYREQKK